MSADGNGLRALPDLPGRTARARPIAVAHEWSIAAARRALGLGIVAAALRAGSAAAFPLIDPSNENSVPSGTELAPPDAQDLQHQLQLANGLAAPPGGGWTFIPQLNIQELLTDNVLQTHAPRQWDLGSFIAPGINAAADMPRLQLTVSYAPTLAIYANESRLNALTQQLSAIGLVTVVPDLAYIDVRALSGVRSLYGGIGGLGTIGTSPTAINADAATVPSLAGNSLGLNKDNEVQTSSFTISPYLLRRFGDWGTGKLGYSLNVTQSSDLNGFVSSPLPSGGANAQTLISNEEVAHFATGDFLGVLQDSLDVDLLQTSTTSASGYNSTVFGGATAPLPETANTSNRAYLSDTLSYSVNRHLTVFGSLGHEDIIYSNLSSQTITGVTYSAASNGQLVPSFTLGGPSKISINDATWSLGATVVPNANSQLTVSFGHLNGYNSFAANGYYAMTPRTVLTVSYGSSLGTQLENLQSQLGQATTNGSGSLVNAQTTGTLFGNTNALAVQDGVFRTDTLTVGSVTTLARDIVSANLLLTKQTQLNATSSSVSSATTFSLQWIHQLSPDLTLSAVGAYALQNQGYNTPLNPGNSRSVAGSIALQYQISETLTASLRYAFYGRQSTVTTYDVYQNLLILGISKTF